MRPSPRTIACLLAGGWLALAAGCLQIDTTVSFHEDGSSTITERLNFSRTLLDMASQQDAKLQLPIICNLGKEVWKTKEAKMDDPKMGDTKSRGMLMEVVTASTMLAAGGDILIMRHPEALKLARKLVRELASS